MTKLLSSVTAATLLTLCQASPSFAASESGYFSIPSAKTRAAAGSGYLPLGDFSTIYVVQEVTGQPNTDVLPLIRDAVVRADLEDRHYRSLQVRELAVRPNHKLVRDQSVNIPFAVTLKHDASGNMVKRFFDRGSLDVAGTLEIKIDGSQLSVTVSRFDDSQFIEALGRFMRIGREADVEFARAIVPPAIESYFNSDPTRIQNLLGTIDVALITP